LESDRTASVGLTLALLAGEREGATRWLEGLLESGGYGVLRERTGHHALERARATQPDVIIIDADLPDQTGVELCGALREDPRIASSTPILLAVAETCTREQRLAALRAGAWHCIEPPHDADALLLQLQAYARAKLDADRARVEGLLDSQTGLYNRQGLARRARELGSQAFRDHGALACVAVALDVERSEAAGESAEPSHAAVTRCVHALKSSARLSDVIGRLSPTEFAIVAPGTGAGGARRLAERLAESIHVSTVPAESAQVASAVRVRCGYEAVANMGYSPIEPVELLVRASAALRTGKPEAGGSIRRFDEGTSARY
jgi:diguanylate cyclase (GGDEF)-like protein